MKNKLALVFSIFCYFSLQAQITLPERMFADTAHAPFIYGVASGDPTANQVILWTHVDGLQHDDTITVWYEVSDNASFSSIVLTGNVVVDSMTNFNVKVDVGPLQPGTFYYYRFRDKQGRQSVTGRTKTAPLGATNHVRLAVMSCSSIYSGFFNAFARIGERNDLDAVVHLGDYIYDFVDEDEEIRVPVPYPTEPNSLNEFRERHAYYLLDPDLRLARQMHPFILVWDNHDIAGSIANNYWGSLQAFHEWTPMRTPDPLQLDIIYRSFEYGNLASLIMTDFETFNGLEEFSPGSPSAWGSVQRNWVKNELLNSGATWKLIGNQKMMGRWSSLGLNPNLGLPGNGVYFDPSSWDGHIEERLDLLNFVSSHQIDNLMVLSGDAHITMYIDLTTDPDGTGVYDPATGNGAVGVEFLPTSITRGNFDESGIPLAAQSILEQGSYFANPNHIYSEFFQHGYGIVVIKPDSIVAEVWYSPILQVTSEESFHRAYVVHKNENHWRRNQVVLANETNAVEYSWKMYPNPASQSVLIETYQSIQSNNSVIVMDLLGKTVIQKQVSQESQLVLDVSMLKDGIYIVYHNGETQKLLINRQ